MAQDTLLGFPAHILPYRFLDSLRQGKHLPFRPVLSSFWKGALLVEKRIDRVIFTCGGTAGHVNPAIAVAQLMAPSAVHRSRHGACCDSALREALLAAVRACCSVGVWRERER